MTLGLTTGIDSLSLSPAIPGNLDRDVHTGRVNRFDCDVGQRVAASTSPRLIGPTAPIRINTLVMVIANVFMVVFPFFDHSTRDRVLTPRICPGKTYLYDAEPTSRLSKTVASG